MPPTGIINSGVCSSAGAMTGSLSGSSPSIASTPAFTGAVASLCGAAVVITGAGASVTSGAGVSFLEDIAVKMVTHNRSEHQRRIMYITPLSLALFAL